MAFSSVLQMYLDWANSLLCEHGIVINELKEFQDGRIFALLIHILTDTQLFPSSEDGNDDEVSSLDRVQTILDYLLGLGVRLKVTATGMLNGELKCILDVIWAIILHFTIHSRDTPVQQKTVRNGKKLLLQWCTSQLGENALDVGKSLTQCFEKNNKLAELIGLFCSYSNSSTETYVNKLTSALIAAEDNFGIAKSLLSPADVIHGTIEEHALTIYIALLRRKVTMLGSENSQSEKSSDLNTSAGLPEGLTEEVANSLSQTFSFKFMRSPSQPIAPASHAPRPPSQSPSSPSSSPSTSSPSSNIAVNAPSIPRGQLPVKKLAASKIPVSSTRRQHQQTPSRKDQSQHLPGEAIQQPSSREGHKPTALSREQESSFKLPSGIPVRKVTQKLSSVKPIQTSTPLSKQKQDRGMESRLQPELRGDGEGIAVEDKASPNEAELDVSDIGEYDEDVPNEHNAPTDDVDMDGTGVLSGDKRPRNTGTVDRKTNETGASLDEKKQPTDNVNRTTDVEEVHLSSSSCRSTETDACHRDKNQPPISRRAVDPQESSQVHVDIDIADLGSEHVDEGDKFLEDIHDREKEVVKKDGDTQRAEADQLIQEEEDEGENMNKRAKTPRASRQDWKGIDGRWSKGDGSFVDEEGGLLRKGTELSFVLPKGLDLSGGRGDELLAMLEAIGNEGRQLRQELNEAKAREDFLTKKLNERFSSQEEEVINRLVGELEMLRRENQRMFHELATARESASEDQKRCEKLQGAVDRLQMDVERLTAENFRLKFAAETGYEVTGEDLLAAMADSDIGFQLLPSPVMDRTNKNSQEDIPSPILTAQAEHESKLLAMRAETSSMRKLQELLTQAHAENRKLKAEQQQRGRTCELEGEMSKVREELCQARSVGDLLKEENTQLKGRMVKAKMEIEGLRQRFQEMEAEAQSKGADSKNEIPAAGTETQTSQSNSSKDTKETGDSFSREPKNKHNEEQLNSCFRAAPAEIAQGNVVNDKVTMGRNEFSVGAVSSTSHQSQRKVDGIAKFDRSHEARIHIDSTELTRLVDNASTSDSTGGTRKSKSSPSSVKSALTLSLSQHETASDKGESEGNVTREEGDASSRVKESPGAVVDWKYLATSPGPATNSPCFSQLLASEQEIETASEVESEAESRASDLFASSTVSSPVSKFLSSTKGRRASLGGLIVARAQNSPPGTHLESHSAIHPNVKEEDGTLIDKSYLDTSPDYFTADEGSVNRGHATNQTDDYSRPIISAPGSDTTLTPYHTPVNPRSRLKFSSLTNTLESLKSISRKAREDIETEVSVSGWSSQRETSQVKANSMSSEQERRLIQEELCRIRLDNNIPGEKYPELGGEQRTSNGFQVTFSSRFLPRWRKFQYRRRRTNSNGPLKANDSATTGSRIHVHPMASSADVAVMNVSNIMDPYDHQIYGVRNVYNGHGVHGNGSPSRSSSDEYSDEYKPLPLELRQPRKLAEHSPSKTCGSFRPLGQKGQKGQNDGVSPSATGGKTLTVYAHDQISESSERDVPLLGPENGHHPQSDRRVGSSSEDIAASDSVSVVSSPMSKQSPSSVHPAADNGMPPGGLDTDALVCSSRHQVNHCVTNASDGAEGEMSGPAETLTTEDLDALAERIILEGDSGVSLTSSIDLKNGLQSTYKHGLLTQEEQTYANALIAKYVHQLADK
ncbi:uncharacterized protein [Diadema setosum]|uniref:uncharacterized protein n=1 Tax=Diadema setosum TaxID=31175 RepID=UPI003B3B69D4